MIENNLVITTKKGKQKINLDAPLYPGRQFCQCHAQVHNLINNCLICGRIVCEQEGAGACFFCGNDVLARGQRADFGQDEEAFPEFQDPNSDVSKAIQHKNKMIEFDKSNFIQKNVFDEQTDWYAIADDVWQDKKNRKKAMEQLVARSEEIQENDQYIHVQYDVRQGKWIENKPVFDEKKFKQKASDFLGQIDQNDRDRKRDDSDDSESYSDSDDDRPQRKKGQAVRASANKSLKQEQQSLYDEIKQELEIIKQSSFKVETENKQTKDKKQQQQPQPQAPAKKNPKVCSVVKTDEFTEFQKEVQMQMMKEIQQNDSQSFNGKNPYDETLFDMQLDDEGKCLSMLQPWASLLVEGFKRFEGRFWTTNYKGPLYIHAGATPATQEKIDEIENQYKEQYKGVPNMPPLPKRYPTGCLIGCVDLQGVLTKDEYFANIPEKFREDSQCDHIFVVRNPRKLFYPIKMKGSKNIFDIPDDIRINCKNQLIQVPSTWYEWCAKNIDIDEIQGNYDDEEDVEGEQENQPTEEDKFKMSYPTLGDKQSSTLSKKASQEAPPLSKKRSNQKKDFMQSADIHNKLRGFASDIKVKMEGFGFMLAPFLSIPEQTQIADYILSKSGGSYKIGITNVDQFQVDNTFPLLEKIQEYAIKSYCYFTEGKKSDCLNQMKHVEYFYLNQKQKRFAYKQDYFLIIMLGCDYEVVVQNNQTYKTKSVKIQNATVLMQLYDEHTSIIYEQAEATTKKQAKDINLKDTITDLVICFKTK